MKQCLTIIMIVIGIYNVKCQDSTYFTGTFFAHGIYDRWANYEPGEINRRADKIISLATEWGYQENGMPYRSTSPFMLELPDGNYMQQKLMEIPVIASVGGAMEPFELVPNNRNWGKYAQVMLFVPNDFHLQNGSSPFEYALVNTTEAINENVFVLKEENITTIWDQDSTIAIWNCAHAIMCHNDGFNHMSGSCKLHNPTGGFCFEFPSNTSSQIQQRAIARCEEFSEVYLTGLPSQVNICQGENETVTFTSNGNVTVSSTGGVSAVKNGNNIVITGSSDGIVNISSTDGTIDTVLFQLSVDILPNEVEVLNPEICDGDSFQMENGDFISSAGSFTITIPNGANNGCNRTVTYNLTILPNESKDTIFTIHMGEEITLPNGTVLDDTDNGETGSYILIGGATNGCSLTVNWTVEVTTAVIDVGKDERVSVYPNPFQSSFNIDTDPSLEIEKVILLTSVGQKIYEGPYTQQVQVYGANGIYILQLISQKGDIFVTRLIKH